MLIVTTNEIAGYQIESVLGEVMGLTVRSQHIGANIMAGFKSIGGGEISEYTRLVYDSRNQVMERMWQEAQRRGANAVIAMRFDNGDIASNFTEVCAYGTAVVVRPIATLEEGGTPQSVAHAQQPQQPGPQDSSQRYPAGPQQYSPGPPQHGGPRQY
ncbi:MAG: YbjQ family protein [Micrococcales bacterium]|nr:YbjQ family protein [Micrococcales bacterium]